MNQQEISDRIELKALVDNFSNMADEKDFDNQALLFTEDAIVNTVMDGKIVATLNGRSDIQKAFSDATGQSKIVFHMNGQQSINFTNKNLANGISYTFVTVVNIIDGKAQLMQAGARYEDTYKKINDEWLIAKRNTNFVWSKSNEYQMPQF